MHALISPILLYIALAIGAVGVFAALPRKAAGPRILGALLAAAGGGLLMLGLTLAAGDDRPSVFFYIFALIGLGASLRVITQPRPVYAALYFILTILASAGLYVLLAAEFLTFALVIIYAGAILITYLFVIMLATEAPRAERLEALNEYDAISQAPLGATALGFLLLGALTGLLNVGAAAMDASPEAQRARSAAARAGDPAMEILREKAKAALVDTGFPADIRVIAVSRTTPYNAQFLPKDIAAFQARIDAAVRVRSGETPTQGVEPLPDSALTLLLASQGGEYRLIKPDTGMRLYQAALPGDAAASNIEAVGVTLLASHPLALELAGVLLLMAMLGAVVLARRRIDADGPQAFKPLVGEAA